MTCDAMRTLEPPWMESLIYQEEPVECTGEFSCCLY